MRILRKTEAAKKIGYSPVHMMRLARAGLFPRKVVLGPGAVGFLEHELDEWIAARAAERESA